MTNAHTKNYVKCNRGFRQSADKVSFQEARDFCGGDGLQTQLDTFPCKGHKSFWTGLKRYNATHFTDGVNMTKIGKLFVH